MQDLRVIGVENGILIVASEDGTRFRLAVDEVLKSRLRQSPAEPPGSRKLTPREIQGHIRSGMSAEEVADSTGVSIDYVRKFEGPVLAEREHVIETALGVAVHTALESDTGAGSTFGSVIRARLLDIGATGERWASWKESGEGWIVKLAFTADNIDHDARWHYEPKRSALAPLNSEAKTLSQQGEMPGGLIPRLRAVGGDERVADASRFDSGAFDVGSARSGDTAGREFSAREFTAREGGREGTGRDGAGRDGAGRDTASHLEAVPYGRAPESSPEVAAAAINRAPADDTASSQTADLLEALRRRRGERESAAAWNDDEAHAAHPSSAGGTRAADVPLDVFDDNGTATTAPQPVAQSQPPAYAPPASKAPARKGRAAMPSWDEIVFGAKSDDDLA
ncbi:septation protein SepH [Marisediminicola senii]|uniref:septation protein SepH n=1 Tax=Marisediminicola senii TaxID=2711233 RepID=UPI0013EB78BA|nr:septation protein SepH [Marisediminicola senii]